MQWMHADQPKKVISLKSFNKQLLWIRADFWLRLLQSVLTNIGIKYL